MATFKHISSKNADYGAAEQYLTFEHDEFTMKPTLDENGRLVPREDYRLATLNCGDEDFAIACMGREKLCQINIIPYGTPYSSKLLLCSEKLRNWRVDAAHTATDRPQG